MPTVWNAPLSDCFVHSPGFIAATTGPSTQVTTCRQGLRHALSSFIAYHVGKNYRQVVVLRPLSHADNAKRDSLEMPSRFGPVAQDYRSERRQEAGKTRWKNQWRNAPARDDFNPFSVGILCLLCWDCEATYLSKIKWP